MATVEAKPIVLQVPEPAKWIEETLDEQGRYWLLLGMTNEMNQRVEELALRTGDSKADLINNAIGLFKAALDAVDEGKQVGVAGPGQDLETEFFGS